MVHTFQFFTVILTSINYKIRVTIIILIFGFLVSCSKYEKEIFLDAIQKTNKTLVVVNAKNGPCLSRYLLDEEMVNIKNGLSGGIKKVDIERLDFVHRFILYQDDLRLGALLIDSSDKHFVKFVSSENTITFQIKYDLDQYLDDIMNIKRINCTETKLGVKFDSISVMEFVEMLKIKDPVPHGIYRMGTLGQADSNWITKDDVAKMIDLIDSKDKTYCIAQLISSQLPGLDDYSTLGGQVMNLIDSYRFKKRYPYFLTECTKNDENRKKEILDWWEKEKNKK